jgi:NifU-like protein involved in Fe-S cluster formation
MAQGMNAPLYTTEILRLAASLPEPRQLERVDGKASERSPTCGSTVATEVKMKDGRVEAISQRVTACAFGQASATLVAQQAPSRDRAEVKAALDQLERWLSGKSSEPPAWPGYEALSPALPKTGRHGAIILPLRSLLAAMDAAG